MAKQQNICKQDDAAPNTAVFELCLTCSGLIGRVIAFICSTKVLFLAGGLKPLKGWALLHFQPVQNYNKSDQECKTAPISPCFQVGRMELASGSLVNLALSNSQ